MDLILQKYQILIAGSLGFLGVILTIATNGYFNRRQHIRELNQKKNSIKAALVAELEVNLSTFKARAEEFSTPKDKVAYLPLITFIDVYKSLINDIGLLPESEIKKLVKAYLLIEEVPQIALLHFKPHTDGFIAIEPEKRQKALQFHQERLAAIEQAIKLLKCV